MSKAPRGGGLLLKGARGVGGGGTISGMRGESSGSPTSSTSAPFSRRFPHSQGAPHPGGEAAWDNANPSPRISSAKSSSFSLPSSSFPRRRREGAARSLLLQKPLPRPQLQLTVRREQGRDRYGRKRDVERSGARSRRQSWGRRRPGAARARSLAPRLRRDWLALAAPHRLSCQPRGGAGGGRGSRSRRAGAGPAQVVRRPAPLRPPEGRRAQGARHQAPLSLPHPTEGRCEKDRPTLGRIPRERPLAYVRTIPPAG